MHSALTPLIRLISRNLVALVTIALVLVLGNLIRDKWRELKLARADLMTLSSSDDAVQQYQQTEVEALKARVAGYRQASIDTMDGRISALKITLAASELANTAPLLTLPLPQSSQVADRVLVYFKDKLTNEMARQELHYLQRLRTYVAIELDQKAGTQKLEQLRREHVQIYTAYVENMRARQQLTWPDSMWIKIPLIRLDIPHLNALEMEHQRLLSSNAQAAAAYQDQHKALLRIKTIAQSPEFLINQVGIIGASAPLREARAKAQAVVAQDWGSRLLKPILDMLPMALLILLLAILGRLAVKVLFYYVLAPMATKLAPICLERKAVGQIASRDGMALLPGAAVPASAVSQTVYLENDEQLLILPDHIQSVPLGGSKKTKWLLDWTCPWTSLISGMYALTCIRTDNREALVLSASENPISEIALITLPAGAAMVFHPRGMVGVIYPSATPLKITRRWRLGSLHAWLTLQLRYLIFHGPVTLIVSGSRGVRIEPAGQGRMISQASTLGFSANLNYTTVRCETFFPFYQGKTALLQDAFAGSDGYYVYDETPRASQKSGRVERGLEGITDAILKVFGI